MSQEAEWETTLTIAISESASPSFSLSGHIRPANVLVVAPQNLPETVTLGCERKAGGYAKLRKDGANVTIPADTAVLVVELMARSIQLLSSSPAADNRTFEIYGIPAQR